MSGTATVTTFREGAAGATPQSASAGGQLRSIVERLERLGEERDALASDIRDIYKEAAGNGFDPVALRAVVRLRKRSASERAEFESILDTYLAALGDLP